MNACVVPSSVTCKELGFVTRKTLSTALNIIFVPEPPNSQPAPKKHETVFNSYDETKIMEMGAPHHRPRVAVSHECRLSSLTRATRHHHRSRHPDRIARKGVARRRASCCRFDLRTPRLCMPATTSSSRWEPAGLSAGACQSYAPLVLKPNPPSVFPDHDVGRCSPGTTLDVNLSNFLSHN